LILILILILVVEKGKRKVLRRGTLLVSPCRCDEMKLPAPVRSEGERTKQMLVAVQSCASCEVNKKALDRSSS
jgi:hypothetical protein